MPAPRTLEWVRRRREGIPPPPPRCSDGVDSPYLPACGFPAPGYPQSVASVGDGHPSAAVDARSHRAVLLMVVCVKSRSCNSPSFLSKYRFFIFFIR